MDGSAAVLTNTIASSIIPEMDTGGLSLLTDALLERKADPFHAITSLPLPDPLPPEQDDQNIKQEESIPEDEPIVTMTAPLEVTHESGPAELLPPASIDESNNKFSNPPSISNAVPTQNEEDILLEHERNGDIAAYFALEFLDMQYIYYLKRSFVSLGRSSNKISEEGADIDLGPLKNISRLHARIEYEEELERFVLAVIGRNGAFVDGMWVEPGRRVPLADK
jgi:hypothetical protein